MPFYILPFKKLQPSAVCFHFTGQLSIFTPSNHFIERVSREMEITRYLLRQGNESPILEKEVVRDSQQSLPLCMAGAGARGLFEQHPSCSFLI